MNISKAAAYHGIEGVKFAPRGADGTYASGEKILKVLYAKSLNPSALLEDQEMYADDRLLFRVPNDKGYDLELGTTAPDPELEMAQGFAMEGAAGLLDVNQVAYPRGALYYEHIQLDINGRPSKVKTWMLNVELGKGVNTHTTDESSVNFGATTYKGRVYGEDLMAAEGSAPYLDDNGMGRKAFMATCWPGDAGYATFGDAVPVAKVTANPNPPQLAVLTVGSVAGAETGKTKLTVAPALSAGDQYRYKTGDSAALPAYDEAVDLSGGWTAWDGSAEIAAETGKKLVLVECTAQGAKARKGGAATVTAKA